MANRDVTVRLKAEIGQYESAMKRAGASTTQAANAAKAAATDMDKFGNVLSESDKAAGRYVNGAGRVVEANGKFAAGFTKNTEAAKAYRAELNSQLPLYERISMAQRENEQSWSTLSSAAMVGGATMVAAVGGIVVKYASFDKAMSAVQASTHASGEEMEKLRELAMRAGADTAYSGEEAAAGINELAKAGVSTNDILRGGLNGALSLAAAGQIEVGDAAELAATAMTQFNLEGKDLGHVADLLAAGAGKAQGSVGDMGYALKQSGLVAAQAGISIEETVGTLSAFASAGLVGSDAGTSFKTMLQKLQNPSKEAQGALDELGISMYDANGEFVGMTSLADQLKTSMQDLTPAQRDAAMATIFGADAVRAANVLYAQGGEGIQDWINKVNDAGYAAETAAALQDNLAGDIEKLGGAFDTIALQAGGSLNDMFRDIVQGATGLLDIIGQIPGPVLTAGTAIMGIGGMSLLAVGGLMKGVSAVNDFRQAADDLGLSLPKLDGKMGAVARSAGIFAAGMAIAVPLIDKAFEGSESAAIGADRMGNALAGAGGNLDGLNAQFRNAEWANGNGSWWMQPIAGADGFAGSVGGVGDAIAQVQGLSWDENLISWGAGLIGVSDNTAKAKEDIAALDSTLAGMVGSGSMGEAQAAFKSIAEETERSGGSIEELTAQFPTLEGAILDYATSLGVTLTEQETLDAMMGNMPPKLQEAADTAAAAQGGLEGMGAGMDTLAASAEAATVPLDELVDAFRVLGEIHVTETQAMQDFNNSLFEMQGQLAATGAGLDATGTRFDTTTAQGQAANGMLIGMSDSMWVLTEAQANNSASQETLQGTMAGTYQAMIDSMTAMGLTTEQADILTRAVLGVPEGVDIDTWMADTAKQMADATTSAVDAVPDGSHTDSSMSGAAKDMADQTQGAISRIERNVRVEVSTIQRISTIGSFAQPSSGAGRGPAIGRYTGGYASPMRGFYRGGGLIPGTPPANPFMDNLPGLIADTGEPIMVRSREYIVNEPGTHRGNNLSWLRFMNAGGTMQAPAPRGFAVGGSPAGYTPAQTTTTVPTVGAVNITMQQVDTDEQRFAVRSREAISREFARLGI